MSDVKFEDFTVEVMNAIDSKIDIALEEAAGELEAQAKRNTRVDTGRTKGSWSHVVESGDSHTAHVGSNYENAIWEEFGTGEYALHGDGRKGGWRYKDANGDWHFTHGKKPQRPLHFAFERTKGKITDYFKKALGSL